MLDVGACLQDMRLSHLTFGLLFLFPSACATNDPAGGGDGIGSDDDDGSSAGDGSSDGDDGSSAGDDGWGVGGAGGYPTLAGCDAPGTTYTRDVFVDPAIGNDVAGDGSAANPFKSTSPLAATLTGGEHVHLGAGAYGAIRLRAADGPALATNTAWIWLDFAQGAVATSVRLAGVSHVLLTGLEVGGMTAPSGQAALVDAGGSTSVVLADNYVRATTDRDALSAAAWIALPNGIDVRDTRCSSVVRNQVENVRHGFGIGHAGQTPAANSCKLLVQDNALDGFSGDGLRLNCSDLVVRGNRLTDGYVGSADGDGNHDDFMQGFALGGAVYAHLLIEDNVCLERTGPATRPFLASYQGINVFDGLFQDVVVRRNVVVASAYHGITFAGVDGVTIDHNTVVNLGSKPLWIALPSSKTGVPAKNTTVTDNLANKFNNRPYDVDTNNQVVTAPAAEFVAFDVATGTFDLRLRSTSALASTGAGAL